MRVLRSLYHRLCNRLLWDFVEEFETLYARRFVCVIYWLGLAHLSLGAHVYLAGPNLEVHFPGGFFRLGWHGKHRYVTQSKLNRSYGKDYYAKKDKELWLKR